MRRRIQLKVVLVVALVAAVAATLGSAQAPNVVRNPSFTYWTPTGPFPWTVGIKHEENDIPGDPRAILKTADAFTLPFAVQLGTGLPPIPGEGFAIIQQDVPIVSGQKYLFVFYAKGWNVLGGPDILAARAYVWWMDPTGYLPNPPIEIKLPESGIASYVQTPPPVIPFTKDGQAPSNATRARIQIGKYSWGFIRVDDVALIQLPPGMVGLIVNALCESTSQAPIPPPEVEIFQYAPPPTAGQVILTPWVGPYPNGARVGLTIVATSLQAYCPLIGKATFNRWEWKGSSGQVNPANPTEVIFDPLNQLTIATAVYKK